MSGFGHGVTLKGIPQPTFGYTYKLASATVVGDIGKAMSLDTTAANTAKLAADGDRIIGVLVVYEDRTLEGIKVGTIRTKDSVELTIKTGETVAIGDTVIGAGSGEVKAAATKSRDNWVVAVSGSKAIVHFN
jgi:hypothetical protein